MLHSRDSDPIRRVLAGQSHLFESDEELRSLRRSAAGGDADAEAAHARMMRRTGRDAEYMKPYMDTYKKARLDHVGASMGAFDRSKMREAALAHSKAREELHAAAGRLGEHPGYYLDPPEPTKWAVSNEYGRRAHVNHLTRLHGGESGPRLSTHSRATFKTAEDRSSFVRSVQKHYPNADLRPFEQRGQYHVDYNQHVGF